MRLNNKIVVITGTASGVSAEHEHLARTLDVRHADEVEECFAEITEQAGRP
jgi:hypothetical protein